MTRLDSRQPLPEQFRGAIIALGNFDGFHLGHQAVVGEAVRWARSEGRPALVATFDPHPKRFFVPDAPSFRLTTLDQREDLFTAAGADAMVVIHFDAAVAAMSGADWVEGILHRQFGAAGVVTGEDFTFGKGRGGDVEVLKMLGQANRISVDAVAPVGDGGEPVSSSRIRDSLEAGHCAAAARLLTRPFAIEGVVEHGDKRGRAIGWPTANIALGPYLRPRFGVYAVRGRLPAGRVLDGVANLGTRPMFDPPRELLEPYFFDFDGDLYGQTVEVELISFIRDETAFESLEDLKDQIAADAIEARARLT
jgi:riboflavin kinase/FMN adenylyltransferase